MLEPAWRIWFRTWHLPVLLALICGLLALGGTDVTEALRYQRAEILHGQLWRLLSAHLVHLGDSHLLLNLCGLGLVWGLFPRELSGPAGWWVLLCSALGVSLGLLVFDPGLVWYVGLSGVLHGLFVAGALRLWRERPTEAALMLAVLAGKLIWEQRLGPLPGTSAIAGGPVVVDAHLFGTVGGCLGALLRRYAKLRPG
jgi:rhomboid family GlyGly-CTERM serine protease